MARVITLSPSTSTVSVDKTELLANGSDVCTVTVTLSQSNAAVFGGGLAASNVVLSVTPSTGVTITQPTGTVSQAGTITGSFVSTNAALVRVQATVCGQLLSSEASVDVGAVAPDAGAGSVDTFTDISRDASSTAGGDPVTLTVTGATGSPKVWFGATEATNVVVVNSTTITCTVPANSAGVVAVWAGGVALSNPRSGLIGGAFEYLPAPTTTFVNRNFNDGVLGTGLEASVGGNVEVTTAEKYAGTHSVRTYRNTTGTSAIRNSTLINISAEANGVYARYYQLIPTATVSTLGDQIKTSLFRTTVGSGQPGWIMAGIGPDFNDGASDDTLVSFLDNGVVDIGTNNVFGRSGVGVGVWREWIFWQYWDSGASEGRMKTWIDGKLQYDVQSSVAGGTGNYRLSMGIAYIQNPTGTADVYIDEVFIANGFPTFVEPA